MTAKQESQLLTGNITGSVASIGKAGNLITDIAVGQLKGAPRDETIRIKFGDHETIGIYPEKHDQPDSTMVALLGDSGFLEIEIVGINLSEMLGIQPGADVAVTW